MASSSSRRRRRDPDDGELKEGEYVPGSCESSDTADDDQRRYLFQSRREEVEVYPRPCRRIRRLEDIITAGAAGALPSPTPSCESDGTISDNGNRSPSSVVVEGPAARGFACPVCGKQGFVSRKAVDGHMRVHNPHGRHAGQQQGKGTEMKRVVAVNGGWAATGRRGWTVSRPAVAVSLNSESNHSMAIVAVQPLEPMPMAIAITNLSKVPVASTTTNLPGESSSAQPMRSESVATVVAGANPSTEAVVHQPAAPPPAAPQAQVLHQPSAPQAQVLHQLYVPPPAGQQGQLVHQPARKYTCKLCGMSYTTHQALGGHAAGHMNKRKEAEAAAAATGMAQDGAAFLAAPCRGPKAEQPHECHKCHKVFAKGEALGGHMRKHYTGPPIGHKKCPAPPVPPVPPAIDLKLSLSIKAEEPSTAPAVAAGRVRLFGVEIGPLVQATPSEQQGSGGTTEGCSSAGSRVQAPLEQQGSGTTEGSSSSAGEQQ